MPRGVAHNEALKERIERLIAEGDYDEAERLIRAAEMFLALCGVTGKEDTVTEPTHGDFTDALGPCEVVVNDVRYVRETTLFAAMERLDALKAERDERILTATADEWLAHRFNQEYKRAEAAENRLAEAENRLAEAENLLSRVRGEWPAYEGDLDREINEFLTRRQ